MSVLPTVKVVHPDAPDGWVIINESDLTPEHQRFYDVPPMTVIHGARGRWFVKQGATRLSHGFETKDEAEAECVRLQDQGA